MYAIRSYYAGIGCKYAFRVDPDVRDQRIATVAADHRVVAEGHTAITREFEVVGVVRQSDEGVAERAAGRAIRKPDRAGSRSCDVAEQHVITSYSIHYTKLYDAD